MKGGDEVESIEVDVSGVHSSIPSESTIGRRADSTLARRASFSSPREVRK